MGAVPAKFIAPAAAGAVDRTYDNGTVSADGPRTNEVDVNGNQTSTPGGRYQVSSTAADGTSTVVGDYLSYTPGLTRTWTELTPGAAGCAPRLRGFHQLQQRPAKAATSPTRPVPPWAWNSISPRNIGRISRRIQWGFTTGVTLNSISNKTTGTVTSTLNARTDYYAAGAGTIGTAPASAPSFGQLVVNGVVTNDPWL